MSYSVSMRKCEFYVEAKHYSKVNERLEDCDYVPLTDKDGNITDLDFVGDEVSTGEDEMFEKIAPFVRDGSFIEMRDEDGEMWRWVFFGGKAREIVPKIIWDHGE